MTRYALTSLIAGLLLPPLLGAAGCLTFLILCSTVFTSLDTLAYAIFGSGGDASVSVDELAALAGTISYELLCAISPRVPRVYIR